MNRFCLITILAVLTISDFAVAASASYAVSQTGNLLLVKTPWGSTIYIAPVGFDSIQSYDFEIPLSDFRSGLARANGPTSGTSDAVKPMDVSDASTLIAEANRLYARGNFNRALSYVDEASRREPNNVRVWVMKGSLMHALGHDDLAQQAWKKALDLDPQNAQLKHSLQEIK